MPFTKSKLKKWLLIAAGTFCVITGLIGVFFPVLPTTPFLILAALCYMRSSERLYRLLMGNRLCGSYIRNYLEGRGMTLKAKILTLLLLWLILGATISFAVSGLVVRSILLAVGAGVTIHILAIRTLTENIAPRECAGKS